MKTLKLTETKVRIYHKLCVQQNQLMHHDLLPTDFMYIKDVN